MGTCYRPTRTSESIHEGGERASEQLEEWISHGKLLRSTECDDMFQNVGDTSAVQGYGTEPNTGWEGGMESGRIKHYKLLPVALLASLASATAGVASLTPLAS